MTQTTLISAQLAASAGADKILSTDGTDNAWTDGNSIEVDKWLTIAADTGSQAATTKNSTLTIAGGNNATTAGSGNGIAYTVTIDVTCRETYGFGSQLPMIGAGTRVLDYGAAAQWAIAPIAGTATHVSWNLTGWVDDPDVDIELKYGTIGAETTLTVVENVAASAGAQAIASPPSISAGDTLWCQIVNTGGNDVIADFSVTIIITE